MPYKLIITYDGDLIIYDVNYKILGSVINKNNFENVDFAWPDERYFWDKSGTIRFHVSLSSFFLREFLVLK